MKTTTTQEEEHGCTMNKVSFPNTGSTHEEEQHQLKNEVSNDCHEINANTINCIFLASLSDNELPLRNLLPHGFKMKKDVKSEKNETKNRRITRSRKS